MNLIIDFAQDASDDDINQYLSINGCAVVKVFSNFDKTYLVTATAQPPSSALVESIINDDTTKLELLADIVDNSPDLIFTNAVQNWWKILSLKKVDLDAPTVTIKLKGDNVNVYVLDSGIDASHPEFADAQVENLYSITGDFADSTGHGTAIASLIAGKTCAISNPRLKICKIFDQSGETKQSALLEAFDAVITDVLANPNKLAVMNCSWAIAKNEYVEQKIQLLIDHNVTIVAAAGNSSGMIGDVTPASIDRVVTIGAYNHDLQPCDFSNYTGPSATSFTSGAVNGGALDGWAPGEQIWVATIGGGYGFALGTSLAAAIHSGIISSNAEQMVMDNGDMMPCIGLDPIMNLTSMSLSRKDLLTYPDSKYADSVNLISTLFNGFTPDMPVPKPVDVVSGISGVPTCKKVFNPLFVKSYDVVGTIPFGMTLNPSTGMVYGTPTISDPSYETGQFTVNLVFSDDSTMQQQVNVVIRQSAYDVSNFPKDDPVLSIVALTCTGSTCGGCSVGQHCLNCSGGKTPDCFCDCSSCVCP